MNFGETTKHHLFKDSLDKILTHPETRIAPDKDGNLTFSCSNTNETMAFEEFLKQLKSSIKAL